MFLNGDGMRGGPLHQHISGAELIGERRTLPRYRFYSIRDEFPALWPVSEEGRPILGELYDVPMSRLRDLLASEPPELELSIVELAAAEPAAAARRARTRQAQGHHALRRMEGLPSPVLRLTVAAVPVLVMGAGR
jgi:gamma-glutamylcyclotransferase (GGCT)/AIG2-like uncharacterized protein YtfP